MAERGSDEAGPFLEAQAQFLSGRIIPLVFGAFGDVNDGVEKLVKVLVRNVMNSDNGLSVSPLVNTDRKGGHLKSCSRNSSGISMFHWFGG